MRSTCIRALSVQTSSYQPAAHVSSLSPNPNLGLDSQIWTCRDLRKICCEARSSSLSSLLLRLSPLVLPPGSSESSPPKLVFIAASVTARLTDSRQARVLARTLGLAHDTYFENQSSNKFSQPFKSPPISAPIQSAKRYESAVLGRRFGCLPDAVYEVLEDSSQYDEYEYSVSNHFVTSSSASYSLNTTDKSCMRFIR